MPWCIRNQMFQNSTGHLQGLFYIRWLYSQQSVSEFESFIVQNIVQYIVLCDVQWLFETNLSKFRVIIRIKLWFKLFLFEADRCLLLLTFNMQIQLYLVSVYHKNRFEQNKVKQLQNRINGGLPSWIPFISYYTTDFIVQLT